MRSIRALLLMGSAQSGIGKSSECRYRISGSARQPGLRRHGEFPVIEDDTGNTGSTYTDISIAASTRYSYRVKSRKSRDTARSRASEMLRPWRPRPTLQLRARPLSRAPRHWERR